MELQIESRLRSMVKSVVWRVLGIAVLALVTYVFTGSLIQSTAITFLHHSAFIFIYYFHERVWLRVKWKRKRWVKPFTYEIVLGHLVLGLISLVVTGSWVKVTLITVTYIENKLWMYVVYDWIWEKNLR